MGGAFSTTSKKRGPGRLGLFVGAGASYELGMPLVWELTTELKRYLTPDKLHKLNAQWQKQGEGGFADEVIDSLATALAQDGMHYEAILGHLEVEATRHRQFLDDFSGIYSWLLQLVSILLVQRHTLNLRLIQTQLPFFDGIGLLARTQAPLWVFSLNHDLLVECMAARLGLELKAGFPDDRVRLATNGTVRPTLRQLEAEVLSADRLARSGLAFLQPGTVGINLLKVHGALDMFTFSDGRDLLRVLPSEASVEGVIETLSIINDDLHRPEPESPLGYLPVVNEIDCAEVDGTPHFLRRSLLSGAFKFDKRTAQVLPHEMIRHFGSCLSKVDTLVSIGYGFGDAHINEVIRAWLEVRSHRSLEIVSPRASRQGIPPTLTHLGLQVTRHRRYGDGPPRQDGRHPTDGGRGDPEGLRRVGASCHPKWKDALGGVRSRTL